MDDHSETQKQAAHLREQYRDQVPPEELDAFVNKLCVSHIIKPQLHWAINEADIGMRASIVQEWEIVNVIDADIPMKFLFSDEVVSDYKGRFAPGEYVFTSLIIHFDEETGLVQTGNSLYRLSGDGEEVNATLREAYNMRTLGQSLHMLRAVEGNLGPNSAITGPDKDD